MSASNRMEQFLWENERIKSMIIGLSRMESDRSKVAFTSVGDENIKYSDDLDDLIIYIKQTIENIMKLFLFDPEIVIIIRKKLDEISNKLSNCLISKASLNNFYLTYIINLSHVFVDKIDKTNFTYNPNVKSDAMDVLKYCNSVNEILHFLHTYITLNEKYYCDNPVIKQSENLIYLRGNNSELAMQIYNEFVKNSKDLKYPVEILSLSDEILILAGTVNKNFSMIVDFNDNQINVDMKISNITEEEELISLQKELCNVGITNLQLNMKKGCIVIICEVQDLPNLISTVIQVIDIITEPSYVKRKRG